MDWDLIQLEAEDKMQNAIESYKNNISKISTGRANPNILSSVRVNYYETLTPLNELASISVPEPRQLLIKPFDKISSNIASAINKASLGVNAIDEGDKVRINFPELTTERRKELVKSLTQYTEQARVLVRSSRQDANKMIKNAKNENEISEDDEKSFLDEIQKLTDKYTKKIEEITKEKEKDLMSM